ncbi:hypothetical protein JB92DRAFT_1599274 [Gautieria morchelliformis]|nr:hypothetical protein JB92DRAFT_1599274 [Gautieria morchelliformis]
MRLCFGLAPATLVAGVGLTSSHESHDAITSILHQAPLHASSAYGTRCLSDTPRIYTPRRTNYRNLLLHPHRGLKIYSGRRGATNVPQRVGDFGEGRPSKNGQVLWVRLGTDMRCGYPNLTGTSRMDWEGNRGR